MYQYLQLTCYHMLRVALLVTISLANGHVIFFQFLFNIATMYVSNATQIIHCFVSFFLCFEHLPDSFGIPVLLIASSGLNLEHLSPDNHLIEILGRQSFI